MRALPYIVAALAGCASVPPGPPPPPPEQSFRAVKSVALVHRLAWRATAPGPGESRRRDPLDVLQDALAARGLRTVTLELTERPPPDLTDIDAVVRMVEGIAQGAPPDAGGPEVTSVGARAAPVLARLEADALAVYTRGLGWGAPPPSPFFGQPLMAPPPATVAAISLVARDGTVVTFAWGGDAFGTLGPANAAEAVDAALALLAQPPAE